MTQQDVKLAWSRVGDQLSGLGLKIKLHAEQAYSADNDESAEGGETDGGDGGLQAALKQLTDAIEHTAEAIGSAVKDDAVRSDFRETAGRFVEALNTTINHASSGFK